MVHFYHSQHNFQSGSSARRLRGQNRLCQQHRFTLGQNDAGRFRLNEAASVDIQNDRTDAERRVRCRRCSEPTTFVPPMMLLKSRSGRESLGAVGAEKRDISGVDSGVFVEKSLRSGKNSENPSHVNHSRFERNS